MSQPRPFLTARWVHLAMLNYEVDPAILAQRIPPGTALDHFGGKTFVSMVGFQFLDTRLRGIPVPFHRHFDEVNLRFYVRHDATDGPRRGVVFIKPDQRMRVEKDQRSASHSTSIGSMISPKILIWPL